jgi:ribose 5-phosphate isomerase A
VTLTLRERNGKPFLTDSRNLILDASFGRIPDPETLANRLAQIPGVVEHGLFLNRADLALVASASGVERMTA